MTLIGAWSVNPETAFIWADTEHYRNQEPAGHGIKLAINQQSGVVGAHTGDTFGAAAIASAVRFAGSFDELLIGLPVMARRAAAETLELPRFADSVALWLFIAVGWSRKLSRLVGVTLEAKTGFVPNYFTRCVARPYVFGLESLHPNEPADIIGFAQDQMRWVQKKLPAAGEGTVTIARVRRGDISVTPFDLPTCTQLSTIPRHLAGELMGSDPADGRPHFSRGSRGLHARPAGAETSPAGFAEAIGGQNARQR